MSDKTQDAIEHLKWLVAAANANGDDGPLEGSDVEAIRKLLAEVERLRTRLLSAAGDDLCRLSQEEIKAMSAGAVKIPPKEEFLASCERFHAQVAGEVGVLTNCLTLAQLIAENERLRAERDTAFNVEERNAGAESFAKILMCSDCSGMGPGPCADAAAMVMGLRAEVERLRADAKRLEYVHDFLDLFAYLPPVDTDDFRATIDAAMKGGER